MKKKYDTEDVLGIGIELLALGVVLGIGITLFALQEELGSFAEEEDAWEEQWVCDEYCYGAFKNDKFNHCLTLNYTEERVREFNNFGFDIKYICAEQHLERRRVE